ncbi:MAG TPA: nuclear transport factor 2 family protein [Acidimicrobiia bacterium]|nr:nuclear transport factor 2 family protein [Acidimicrobiia bacterium]
MPDLQALADRLEIEDVLTRYAWALDSKQFDELDGVFTPDAQLDYTSSGGEAGAYTDVKAWLAKVLPHFPAYQHLVTNKDITIDGDRATSRSEFYNPMVMGKGDGSTSIFFVGGEYHDDLVRTPHGWRITNRVEKSIWTDGAVPQAPPG